MASGVSRFRRRSTAQIQTHGPGGDRTVGTLMTGVSRASHTRDATRRYPAAATCESELRQKSARLSDSNVPYSRAPAARPRRPKTNPPGGLRHPGERESMHPVMPASFQRPADGMDKIGCSCQPPMVVRRIAVACPPAGIQPDARNRYDQTAETGLDRCTAMRRKPLQQVPRDGACTHAPHSPITGAIYNRAD